MDKVDIFVSKGFDGGIKLSTVYNGFRVSKTYYGVSLTRAKLDFRNFVCNNY